MTCTSLVYTIAIARVIAAVHGFVHLYSINNKSDLIDVVCEVLRQALQSVLLRMYYSLVVIATALSLSACIASTGTLYSSAYL
jgi:hypothetical protein